MNPSDIIDIITIFLFAHVVGDFICSDHRRYSGTREGVFKHVVIYAFNIYAAVIFVSFVYGYNFIMWAFVNVALHFLVDLSATELKKWKHLKNKTNLLTGFDQIAHITMLLMTLKHYALA